MRIKDWSSDVCSSDLEAEDRLAERRAELAAADHQLERPLALADGSHAVVDAAGAEAHLADLEAAALAQQRVRFGHPHVGEPDVHVAVRGVVVAEDGHRSEDLDVRLVDREQARRLLLVRRRIWVLAAPADRLEER